jgi:hypothetical protein
MAWSSGSTVASMKERQARQPQPRVAFLDDRRNDALAVLRLQAEHSILDFALELRRLEAYERKAGFRRDQPRWPKRTPGGRGGKWSGGAGTAAPSESYETSPTRGGHHFVSKEVYEKLPLRPETKRIFDEAVTGPFHSGPHGWSQDHRPYNQTVKRAIPAVSE